MGAGTGGGSGGGGGGVQNLQRTRQFQRTRGHHAVVQRRRYKPVSQREPGVLEEAEGEEEREEESHLINLKRSI